MAIVSLLDLKSAVIGGGRANPRLVQGQESNISSSAAKRDAGSLPRDAVTPER
jgi:hypothetical protein